MLLFFIQEVHLKTKNYIKKKKKMRIKKICDVDFPLMFLGF